MPSSREKRNAHAREKYAEDPQGRAQYQREYRALKREKVNKRARDNGYGKTEAVRLYRAEYYLKTKDKQRLRRGLPEPTRPCPPRCELCGAEPGKRSLCLDHCHETGKFRGWLCTKCNAGLGAIGDNLESVQRLLTYLWLT